MQIEQFKHKFIEEATDLINQLEESLLDNENSLDNEECIQQIFRVMHTLKGVSSMYGYDKISDLSHDIESIFESIRSKNLKFSKEMFDIILDTVDHFRKLLQDDDSTNSNYQLAHEELVSRIKDIMGNMKLDIEKPKTNVIPEITETDKIKTYYIIFKADEHLLYRGINLLGLFEELAELGKYNIVNHNFKEHDNKTDDQSAWGIYLVTPKNMEDIEDVFMFVLDNCHIVKISDGNLLNPEEFLNRIEKENEIFFEQIQSGKKQSMVEMKVDNKLTDENHSPQENMKNEISTTQTDDKTVISSVKNQLENTISRISIDASKLDRLMNLVSELVTVKSRLNVAVEQKNYPNLIEIAENIETLSQGFRETALNIRLVSVAEMIMPFKRLIRDLSKSLGKEVNFITQGIDTELDKNILDRLSEPVMHILRNCIDHGIETPDVRLANNKSREGLIKFTSFYSGANVFIQIQDDGAGINSEKIKQKAIEKGLITGDDNLSENEIYNLIFEPGFSTAEKVTDVSGRGVGMDIVRKKIQEVRGEVEINSEKGLGTFFTIKLHQTLSIIDTLLLQVENMHFLVPVSDIEYVDQEKHESIYNSQNKQIELDNNLIPFVSLRDLFGKNDNYPVKEKIVVINKNDKRIAILVDKIIGDHQAVLKPLGEVFLTQEFLSGASMLGDGSLAMMLDTNKLTNKALIEATVL